MSTTIYIVTRPSGNTARFTRLDAATDFAASIMGASISTEERTDYVASRHMGRCRDCGAWGPRRGNGLGLNCGCALE